MTEREIIDLKNKLKKAGDACMLYEGQKKALIIMLEEDEEIKALMNKGLSPDNALKERIKRIDEELASLNQVLDEAVKEFKEKYANLIDNIE